MEKANFSHMLSYYQIFKKSIFIRDNDHFDLIFLKFKIHL